MNNKQLALKNAFEKINPDIIGIEILKEGLRINNNYPSLELAKQAGQTVGEYFSRQLKRPVCVQVFFRNKKGTISDFQYAYAAKSQYYYKGAQVKG